MEEELLVIEDGIITDCTNPKTTSVVIPGEIKEIDLDAFGGCWDLESIEFTGTKEEWEAIRGKYNVVCYCKNKKVKCSDGEWLLPRLVIENGSFVMCCDKSVTELELPSGITNIECQSFDKCSELKSLVFPDGLLTIEGIVFTGCPSLEKVYIPKTVTFIEYDAFCDCINLSSVEFGGTKEQWNKLMKSEEVFFTDSPVKTIKCSDGDVPAIKEAL